MISFFYRPAHRQHKYFDAPEEVTLITKDTVATKIDPEDATTVRKAIQSCVGSKPFAKRSDLACNIVIDRGGEKMKLDSNKNNFFETLAKMTQRIAKKEPAMTKEAILKAGPNTIPMEPIVPTARPRPCPDMGEHHEGPPVTKRTFCRTSTGGTKFRAPRHGRITTQGA